VLFSIYNRPINKGGGISSVDESALLIIKQNSAFRGGCAWQKYNSSEP
jgi:hypothetical protein